jgi:endogenous inhibitor of DNA gyrase (YacG/DUF329 family)
MAKDCPNCGFPNLNNAFKCDKCNYHFDDVIECPHCGTYNLKNWYKCIKCSKKIYVSENKHESNKNKEYSQDNNKNSILFDCVVCNNKFNINTNDNFNSFVCKKCRSIFSYEWINNKLIINVVKREEIIPDNIKELAKYFDLDLPIKIDQLKRNYHKLLSQYHPDKVSHLAIEFKVLSEEKTKEIIEKFELLQDWLKIKK